MRLRALVRLLIAYAIVLGIACILVATTFRLHPSSRGAIGSLWSNGALKERVVLASMTSSSPLRARDNGEFVIESITGESAILTRPTILFAESLVPGHDGVAIEIEGKTAYVTPDDLLAYQGYDSLVTAADLGINFGADVPRILALASERLGISVSDLEDRAIFRRVRVVRTRPRREEPPNAHVTASSITPDDLRAGAIEAARYLTRGVSDDGHFRYLVDAPSGKSLPGYDWPRHAGATYFLAQTAALTHDAEIAAACLRAAALMRDSAVASCGRERCVGTDDVVEIGSAALATIAFVEIVRTNLDPSYASSIQELAQFLRSQQRPDGEFMHEFDRRAQKPLDVQYLYFTGEAALALSRASLLTNDPRDLDAASRAVAHLVGPVWSFFGNRYYFGEEHWTCQAVDDLWTRAPNPRALDFCVRWQAYGRAMQYREGEVVYDAAGAYGIGPLVTPRLTPVGSRCEAGAATLDAMRLAHYDPAQITALDAQLRSSLALLLRRQFRPGPSHLFADPSRVRGAMPGSEVDWQLRIDYAQHTGSALLRALEIGVVASH